MLVKVLSALSIGMLLLNNTFAETQPSTTPQPEVTTNKALDQKDLDVIIYSSKDCFSCKRVKGLFDEKNIKYTEKVVDKNPVLLEEMKTKTDKETVPQVIINEKHVGSYRHLMLGGLDEILEKEESVTKKQETKKLN
jgi:glutaredoxin 3